MPRIGPAVSTKNQILISADGTDDLRIWTRCYFEPVTLRLDESAVKAIKHSHQNVSQIVDSGQPVYGINTGFGSMANQSIPSSDLAKLQENLVLCHTGGAGENLPARVVKLAIALKIASFAKGVSGVRLELVERLKLFLQSSAYPLIPGKGSVGASGDLAPLAHLSAVLIGYGDVEYGGKVISAEALHQELGITPLKLEAKEGLALLNGTQISTALALAALFEAERSFETAIIVGAIMTEAALGLEEAFDPRIHELRKHKGQIEVAAKIKELISGSGFRAASFSTGRRQDPYSIRCQPQILGACRGVISQVAEILLCEADAVTDNPLVLSSSSEMPTILSGGNFHAEPVAFAADMLALAICEMGSLSERRLALLTDPGISGLPPFLTSEPGINSGFMSTQITAAALVAENRQKAHPASVDNVPTVANFEDIVSMATHGARRLLPMIDTLNDILAYELLAAVEGCDHRGYALNQPLEAVRSLIREHVPRMNFDRYFAPAHQSCRALVKDGSIQRAIKGVK